MATYSGLIMPLAYFKDRFLPESECHISIYDRSFRFGDGVFETMLVMNGRLYDTPPHMQRLRKGLAFFKLTLDTSDIEALCNELIRRNAVGEGYIRIIVSRGENGIGAIGYLPKDAQPYLLIQSMEKSYPAFRSLRLCVSMQRVAAHIPCKTNNAMIYTLAMMEAEEQACDNAVLLNADGYVCETASGNLFWIKSDTLYTPSLDLPLVPGTIRRTVLEMWDEPREEGRFTLAQLEQSDEVFMTNIGMIVAAVSSIAPLKKTWETGRQTLRLRERVDAAIRHACRA